MPGPTVGVIANPLAGKDIRRLVAEASPVSDGAKIATIRRAVIGAVEGGATRIVLADDRRALGARAIERLDLPVEMEVLDEPIADSGANSTAAASSMRDRGVDVVIALGGDGTQRDVAKGWRDVPLVPLSTGTNNVFPRHVEATLAGCAAGLVASGAVELCDAGYRAKAITVDIDGAHTPDLALVDVALIDGGFVGSRAVWDTDRLRELVVAIAEPASVGLSSIVASLHPLDRREALAAHAVLGDGGRSVRAPIGPGLYAEVGVQRATTLQMADVVEVHGPGVLSFDGERDVVLADGRSARITVDLDGPRVIDVDATLWRHLSDRCPSERSDKLGMPTDVETDAN